jgi:hypothetical protein
MDAPSVSQERVSEQQGDFGTITKRVHLAICERWRLTAAFADHADVAWQRSKTAAKPDCWRQTFRLQYLKPKSAAVGGASQTSYLVATKPCSLPELSS